MVAPNGLPWSSATRATVESAKLGEGFVSLEGDMLIPSQAANRQKV